MYSHNALNKSAPYIVANTATGETLTSDKIATF